MEYLNITENCRACQIKTKDESQKILIFTSVKLPDIYKETTSLDIHENDGLPKILCCTCYNRLLEAYNFRKMCSAAVLHFQQMLSMDIPEEKYIPLEHLSDSFMAPNSSLDNNGVLDIPSEKINSTSNRVLEIFAKAPAVPVKSEKSQKLRTVDLECTLCNLIFFRKESKEIHMMVEHQELMALSENPIDPLMITKRDPVDDDVVKYSPPDRNSLLEISDNLSIDHDPLESVEKVCDDHAPLISRKTKKARRSNKKSSRNKKRKESIHPVKRFIPLFECDLCNSTFRRKMRVEMHMRQKHLGLKPCQCNICGGGFTRISTLEDHMKTQHGEKKRFSCRKLECNENYNSLKDLVNHMVKCHDERIWSCEHCPYTSLKWTNLTRHVNIIHKKVKDFCCSYCKRAFSCEWNLKKHVMIHTGEKPFACRECDKRYIEFRKLKAHVETHLKSKSKDN